MGKARAKKMEFTQQAQPVWVGRVPFHATSVLALCTLCKKTMPTETIAQHAEKKHKKLWDGVLAGQLGLPLTSTPDVPR